MDETRPVTDLIVWTRPVEETTGRIVLLGDYVWDGKIDPNSAMTLEDLAHELRRISEGREWVTADPPPLSEPGATSRRERARLDAVGRGVVLDTVSPSYAQLSPVEGLVLREHARAPLQPSPLAVVDFAHVLRWTPRWPLSLASTEVAKIFSERP